MSTGLSSVVCGSMHLRGSLPDDLSLKGAGVAAFSWLRLHETYEVPVWIAHHSHPLTPSLIRRRVDHSAVEAFPPAANAVQILDSEAERHGAIAGLGITFMQRKLNAADRGERDETGSGLVPLKAEQTFVEGKTIVQVPHGDDDSVELGQHGLSWTSSELETAEQGSLK